MIGTFVLLSVLGVSSVAQARSTGAPLAACTAIAPDPSAAGHKVASMPLGNNPFTLNVTKLSGGYIGGRTYNLTLTGGATSYEGFLIQARLVADMVTPVGTFISLLSTTQIAPCTPTGCAITHTSNTLKNNLTLQWTAPPAGTGSVVFWYAVVISLSNYYATIVTPTIPEQTGGTTSATTAATTAVTTAARTNPAATTPGTTAGPTTAGPTTAGTTNAATSAGTTAATSAGTTTGSISGDTTATTAGGTSNANPQGAGFSTTATPTGNAAAWDSWKMSTVAVIAVLGGAAGVAFLAINFASLAFSLHKTISEHV